MTTVDITTGEIIDFDPAAAERRAERIVTRLDAIAENFTRVLPMIREAIEKRDDLALGYRSPGEYVADRFGQSLGGLGIEVRRAVVGELTAAGLSSRAIAPVVNVSDRQVRRDVGHVSHLPTVAIECDRPAPASVTGIDGKQYERPTPPAKPTPDTTPEYDNAAQACLGLTRAMSRLLTFQHPNMRAGMRTYWSLASAEVSPVQRQDVTPEQMRVAARGLLELADEWESK